MIGRAAPTFGNRHSAIDNYTSARDPPEPAEPIIEPWLDLSACDAQAGDPFPDYDHEPVFAQN